MQGTHHDSVNRIKPRSVSDYVISFGLGTNNDPKGLVPGLRKAGSQRRKLSARQFYLKEPRSGALLQTRTYLTMPLESHMSLLITITKVPYLRYRYLLQ